MKKRTIIIIILLVIALALIGLYALGRNSNNKEFGEGPLTCYIEGELLTDKFGNEIVIAEYPMDPQAVAADRSLRVRAVDGKFYYTIHGEHVKKYIIEPFEQASAGLQRGDGRILSENAHVKIKIYDDSIVVRSDGEENRKLEVLDSLETVLFWNQFVVLANELNDPSREKEFYKPELLWARKENNSWYEDNKTPTPAIEDSVMRIFANHSRDYKGFTDAGLKIQLQLDSIRCEREAFRINYYAEHPMVNALYDIYDAAYSIRNFDPSNKDPIIEYYDLYMRLYSEKLSQSYPGHPIHARIAEIVKLHPGQPYSYYDLHTADGKVVPIASLIKGKVALIDLWASWCGACRVHSKAMIPIYEKYKDKGFTVVAIARERNRRAMEKAMEKDDYPWPSYLEPINDENGVWSRHGVHGGGGAFVLVDRDGTILSTAFEVSELEPLIRKALGLEQ